MMLVLLVLGFLGITTSTIYTTLVVLGALRFANTGGMDACQRIYPSG